MSNIRRIIVVVLVAAVFSLGAAGCKSGGKAGPAERPKSEDAQKKTEPPKGDHPKH